MFRCLLLLSLLASPAMAFQARNGAEVTGTATEIVVVARPGLSSSESWCAAGDFVIRALGQPATGCITGFVTIGSDNAYLAAADVSVNATNRTTNTDRRGEFD